MARLPDGTMITTFAAGARVYPVFTERVGSAWYLVPQWLVENGYGVAMDIPVFTTEAEAIEHYIQTSDSVPGRPVDYPKETGWYFRGANEEWYRYDPRAPRRTRALDGQVDEVVEYLLSSYVEEPEEGARQWVNEAGIEFTEVSENGARTPRMANGFTPKVDPSPSTDWKTYHVLAVGSARGIAERSLEIDECLVYKSRSGAYHLYVEGTEINSKVWWVASQVGSAVRAPEDWPEIQEFLVDPVGKGAYAQGNENEEPNEEKEDMADTITLADAFKDTLEMGKSAGTQAGMLVAARVASDKVIARMRAAAKGGPLESVFEGEVGGQIALLVGIGALNTLAEKGTLPWLRDSAVFKLAAHAAMTNAFIELGSTFIEPMKAGVAAAASDFKKVEAEFTEGMGANVFDFESAFEDIEVEVDDVAQG